jgi:hypothetical protein
MTDEENLSLYWETLYRSSSALLVKHIEDLRNQISDTSKRDSFYLYFNWRALDERGYYMLALGVAGIYLTGDFLGLDPVESYILREFEEGLRKQTKRFKDTKFFNFLDYLQNSPDTSRSYHPSITPNPREFQANYYTSLSRVLTRVYTVRWNTPRRVKKQEFRRGYRDKGSKASVSELARRKANTTEFSIPEWQLELLRQSKNLKDTIKLLGLLPEEETQTE